MSESNDPQSQIEETDVTDENMVSESADWFDTIRGAALVGKASFPDQIDYYDPEEDEIV
jgi:hypothetical protein